MQHFSKFLDDRFQRNPRDSRTNRTNQMIVKRLEDLLGGERQIVGDGWESRRILLKDGGYALLD